MSPVAVLRFRQQVVVARAERASRAEDDGYHRRRRVGLHLHCCRRSVSCVVSFGQNESLSLRYRSFRALAQSRWFARCPSDNTYESCSQNAFCNSVILLEGARHHPTQFYIVPRTGVFTTHTRLTTGLRLQRRPELDVVAHRTPSNFEPALARATVRRRDRSVRSRSVRTHRPTAQPPIN